MQLNKETETNPRMYKISKNFSRCSTPIPTNIDNRMWLNEVENTLQIKRNAITVAEMYSYLFAYTHTHTHTHIYIYIYIYI